MPDNSHLPDGTPNTDQRRAPRHKVHFPVCVTSVGGDKVNWAGRTCDMSTGGVRFVARRKVAIGQPIEYVVTLSGHNPPVRIGCVGKVLRCVSDLSDADSWEVAVTMDRYAFVSDEVAEPELAAV